MIVVPVLVGLLATLAAAQNERVVMTVDDGASPLDDGQTQEGKTVSITCVYELDVTLEFDHTMKMEFEKDGVMSPVATRADLSGSFNDPSRYSITKVTGGAYATKFEIKAVNNSDAGTYRCLFSYEGVEKASAEKSIVTFSDSKRVVLTVGGEESDSFKVEAGKSSLVGCTAYGGSKPTMMIKLDGQEILTLQVVNAANGDGYEGSARHTFAEGDNGKTVSCEAKVATFPDAVIDSASLEIVAKPRIDCGSDLDRKAQVDESVTVSCSVYGTPRPSRSAIEWTRSTDGSTIKADGGKNDNFGLQSTLTDSGTHYQVTFTIKVTELSFIKYTLTASNDFGTATQSVKLQKGTTAPVGDGGNSASTAALNIFSLCAMLMLLVLH